MNRGAISVIYLALSAVCLVGLYGVYKPQVNAAAGNTFSHVEKFVGSANWNTGESTKQKVTYPSTDLLGLPIRKGSAQNTSNGIEGTFDNPITSINTEYDDTDIDGGDCGSELAQTSDVYGLMKQAIDNKLHSGKGNSVRNGNEQILLVKGSNGYAIDTGELGYSGNSWLNPHYASSYQADNAQGKTIAVMTYTKSNPYSIIK